MKNLVCIADHEGFDGDWKLHAEVGIRKRIRSFLSSLSRRNNSDVPPLSGEFQLETSGTRRTSVFHASSIGGWCGELNTDDGKRYVAGCARKLQYQYTGVEGKQRIAPQSRTRMHLGTVLHASLQTCISQLAIETGAEFEPEVDISPDQNPVASRLNISGHCDGVYDEITPRGRVRFGIEIKTTREDTYNGMREYGPKPYHLVQSCVYQKCLDLPATVILYVNTNTTSMWEYVHWYDSGLWDAIERKLMYVRGCVESGEDAVREGHKSACKYCDFRDTCKPPILEE